MKKFILAALFGAASSGLLLSAAHAEREGERWFGIGLAWYQHPCGWDAFEKYGSQDTPEVRRNYYLTIKHPELCSKVFP